MNSVVRVGAIILAVIIAVAAIGYVTLLRPDIPYATLEGKYGGGASRFMDLPGGLHIHYRDQGNPAGPPVVMVHGFSASLHAWEPWVARLGHDYRIVTLDLPGHGLTRAPADYKPSTTAFADIVDQVAQRLKLGRYVVVGNSMGGAVAWKVVVHHPEAVRGLVLVDAAGWPEEKRAHGDGPLVFKVLGSPLGRLMIRGIDTRSMAADGLKDAYIDPALVTPALVDRYVELSRAPGHRDILLAIVTGHRGQETRATFRTIHTPTLVMHGMDDRLIPFTDGQAFAAAIPGARLVAYPGVGHVPMEQIPDRSAADLKAFLDSLENAPVPPA
jgi:pimeloyl-ACP methyl ester carboxylesterase